MQRATIGVCGLTQGLYSCVRQPEGNDRMTLQCECRDAGDALAGAIAATIREVTKLRGEVAWRETGALPNDGKVIDDVRRHE